MSPSVTPRNSDQLSYSKLLKEVMLVGNRTWYQDGVGCDEGKVVHLRTMKAYMANGNKTSPILNLGDKWSASAAVSTGMG